MVNDYKIVAPIATFYLQGNNTAVSVSGYSRNFGFSEIQDVRESKSSGTTIVPQPTKDSDFTIGLDFGGTKREYCVNGTVVGDLDTLTRFVWLINQVVNGVQFENALTLTYTLGRTYNPANNTFTDKQYSILIKDFTHSYVAGVVSKLNYTLTIAEAKRP